MYCTTDNASYCFYYRKVNSQGGLTFSKKLDDAFISSGFNNWKKPEISSKSMKAASVIERHV